MSVDDPATASAIRRHEERLARDPTSLTFAQLADLYRKVGRVRDAVMLCREGLKRYPHYATARLILVKALTSDGQLDAALAELAPILAEHPGDAHCHRLAAEIERRLGNLEAAVDHLQTAARLDPADRESRSLLAVLQADGPVSGDAAGISRLLHDDTFVTPSFATLCLEQGLAEEAALVFTRLVRKDPNNLGAREGLERALRARRRKG